jgi:hypothetical protein
MTPCEIACALFIALEADDSKGAAGYLTEDFMWEGTFPRFLDKPKFMQLMMGLKRAFPDYSLNVKPCREISSQEILLTMDPVGTHSGTFEIPGLPPVKATGSTVALPRQIMEVKFRGEKISRIRVEHASGGGIQGLLEGMGIELDETSLQNLFK